MFYFLFAVELFWAQNFFILLIYIAMCSTQVIAIMLCCFRVFLIRDYFITPDKNFCHKQWWDKGQDFLSSWNKQLLFAYLTWWHHNTSWTALLWMWNAVICCIVSFLVHNTASWEKWLRWLVSLSNSKKILYWTSCYKIVIIFLSAGIYVTSTNTIMQDCSGDVLVGNHD